MRFRRAVFRPWFRFDFRHRRPETTPVKEDILLPGNVTTIDFSGLPPESMLLLETTLTMDVERAVRLIVSTEADFRAWLDGVQILGQESGPFVPAFHRTPENQRADLKLIAGKHRLLVGLAPAAEGMMVANFAFGLSDIRNNWLPDSVYDMP